MGVGLLSYLMTSHRKLTSIAAIAVSLWALHFAMKGAWTACAVTVLSAMRIIASLWVVHWDQQARLKVTLCFVAAMSVASVLTFEGLRSIPPTVAALTLTVAGLNLKDGPLRKVFWATEGLWLLNAWMLDSKAGMLAAALGIVLNARALYQLYKGWGWLKPASFLSDFSRRRAAS